MNRLAFACVCLLYLLVGWVQVWPDGLEPVRGVREGAAWGTMATAPEQAVRAGYSRMPERTRGATAQEVPAMTGGLRVADTTQTALWIRPVARAADIAGDAQPLNPPQGVSPQAAVVSDMSTIAARLTYYTDAGRMRTGYYTFDGAVAVDPTCIPHGSIIQIEGETRLRVALDTGGLVKGCHVDVWVPSDDEGRAMIENLGERVQIALVQRP